MATGDLGAGGLTDLDRQALVERCTAAESEVVRLRAELAAARAELEQAAGALEQVSGADSGFGLFASDDAAPASHAVTSDRLIGDGSDPRVLSLILSATAVVAAMVAVLALINGTLISPFGLIIVLLTLGLAWGAIRTRVVPIEISVTRGIVYIDQGDTSHRFDIRKSPSSVEMVGRPGDAGWQLRFIRRGLDPYVVDATMVDPFTFVEQLREWRPEL